MARKYFVKECFVTLQGEGARAGRKSVFTRFAGCNLWTGRPQDREKGKAACSDWCDTDFFKDKDTKGKTAEEIEQWMSKCWPDGDGEERWCVLTGGEPLMQVDEPFVEALYNRHWWITVETNATQPAPDFVFSWVCLSPKLGGEIHSSWDAMAAVDEVKIVLPGHIDPEKGWTDEQLMELEYRFKRAKLWVAPMDPPLSKATGDSVLHSIRKNPGDSMGQVFYERNLKRCIDFVMAHPRWALSTQNHKHWNLP